MGTTRDVANALSPFFIIGSSLFLRTQGSENLLWPPINAYIGLAMITELTDGISRQQILDLLGAADLDALRQQVGAVWESIFSAFREDFLWGASTGIASGFPNPKEDPREKPEDPVGGIGLCLFLFGSSSKTEKRPVFREQSYRCRVLLPLNR